MLQVIRVQVNGLTRPLGIDDRAPRFSWWLDDEVRGIDPAAHRVRVALTEDGLESGKTVVWDSGKIEGNALYTDYAGSALAGGTRYWWKVEVWDTEGRYAASAPAAWDTGLFPEDWRADWIWRSRRVCINDFAYFRKEFRLPKSVRYAKLFYSAHNAACVLINGERVGGYGSPAPTDPGKRKYYLAYDVTEYLQEGMNCLAAAAHYLGGGGQNYVDGLPGFRLQLHVTYSDGTQRMFKSDLSWQTLKEMPHRTGTSYHQNRRISAIEDYAAGKLDPDWQYSGFDATKCRRAVKARIGKDDWPMKWQSIPEGAVEEEIVPAIVSLDLDIQEDGMPVQVFDSGKIVSGWPRLAAKGILGVTLRFRYSEDLDDRARVKRNVCNETSDHYYDQYTMRGEGTETWSPDFSYKAFRYFEITGYPEKLEPGKQVVVCSAHSDIAYEGRFRCSDELLNKMYEACIQTQKNNTLGQTVDCPHREQVQYLADTDLQAETLLYNFESFHVLEKALGDFADGQLDDGTFPFVFPSNYEHPDFFLQIPEWDLHFVTLLWKLYGISGDERLLERYYEPAARMIDYYVSTMGAETGLIPAGKGWHISDWPYPTVEHEGDGLTVQQIKAWQALDIIVKMAAITDRERDHETYSRQADRLKESILRMLYDPTLKRFRDSSGSGATHQGVNAIGLYAGLVPEADRESVMDYVAGKEWESKTVLSLPLLRVLFENGRQEQAYALLRREEYPGWGHMIKQGAKTMWEGWDDIESHCHAWNGYPARLLQEFIAGIRPAAPGFADVVIRPYVPEGLSFAEATVPTVRGNVFTGWELLDNGDLRIRLCIPSAMRVRLVIDFPEGTRHATILESGATVWKDGNESSNACFGSCKVTESNIDLALLSGVFDFSVEGFSQNSDK